ncbi:MAG: hypothetical protein HZA01_10615 [Nitrospinae bacterium]|nr:hypothetical protein [Nitrospinota bacterium]
MKKILLFAFAVSCFMAAAERASAGAAKTGTLAVKTVDANGEKIDAPITVAKGKTTVQEGEHNGDSPCRGVHDNFRGVGRLCRQDA